MWVIKLTSLGTVEVFPFPFSRRADEKDVVLWLQDHVGGYIDKAYPFDDKSVVCLVDEEPWFKKLPTNPLLPRLRGDVVIIREKNGRFVGLDSDTADKIERLFKKRREEA